MRIGILQFSSTGNVFETSLIRSKRLPERRHSNDSKSFHQNPIITLTNHKNRSVPSVEFEKLWRRIQKKRRINEKQQNSVKTTKPEDARNQPRNTHRRRPAARRIEKRAGRECNRTVLANAVAPRLPRAISDIPIRASQAQCARLRRRFFFNMRFVSPPAPLANPRRIRGAWARANVIFRLFSRAARQTGYGLLLWKKFAGMECMNSGDKKDVRVFGR